MNDVDEIIGDKFNVLPLNGGLVLELVAHELVIDFPSMATFGLTDTTV